MRPGAGAGAIAAAAAALGPFVGMEDPDAGGVTLNKLMRKPVGAGEGG